jgi:hypothetical protein
MNNALSLYGLAMLTLIDEIGYATISAKVEFMPGQTLPGWEDHFSEPIYVIGPLAKEEADAANEAGDRLGMSRTNSPYTHRYKVSGIRN